MSCPPKFKDLHKAADDAFDKDFHSDCFNNKLSQKYCGGSLGSGSVTQKLNYKPSTGKPSAEFEFKHKMGTSHGKFLEGMDVTKTFSSGSDQMKLKMEKNCSSSGGKFTFETSLGAGLGSGHFSFKKPSITFDLGKEKCTTQLNIKTLDCFAGVESTSLNLVFAAGPAHIGLSGCYGFEKGNIDHHVKLAKSANGLNFALGLKNANNLEMVLSKKLDCSQKLGGLCAWTITNAHLKSQYGINSGDWGSQLAVNYENASVAGLKFGSGKCKVDLKTLEYGERATIKVSDSLAFSFGAKSKLDANFFNNFKIGTSLAFSA